MQTVRATAFFSDLYSHFHQVNIYSCVLFLQYTFLCRLSTGIAVAQNLRLQGDGFIIA